MRFRSPSPNLFTSAIPSPFTLDTRPLQDHSGGAIKQDLFLF
jgi:hypothetical protein